MNDEYYDDLISRGIVAAKKGEFLQALVLLSDAYGENDRRRNADGLSFYGLSLALVEREYIEAIALCEDAIQLQPARPDHYANLARVYLAGNMRKKAVETLETALRVIPDDEILLLLREQMGRRSRPAVPFLSRKNAINRAIGKARARKSKPDDDLAVPADEEDQLRR